MKSGQDQNPQVRKSRAQREDSSVGSVRSHHGGASISSALVCCALWLEESLG